MVFSQSQGSAMVAQHACEHRHHDLASWFQSNSKFMASAQEFNIVRDLKIEVLPCPLEMS